jgi:hypothetical protein
VNWRFWKKPVDEIPNPRDKKKKQDALEQTQRDILHTLQFFVFGIAWLLLYAVSQ